VYNKTAECENGRETSDRYGLKSKRANNTIGCGNGGGSPRGPGEHTGNGRSIRPYFWIASNHPQPTRLCQSDGDDTDEANETTGDLDGNGTASRGGGSGGVAGAGGASGSARRATSDGSRARATGYGSGHRSRSRGRDGASSDRRRASPGSGGGGGARGGASRLDGKGA